MCVAMAIPYMEMLHLKQVLFSADFCGKYL